MQKPFMIFALHVIIIIGLIDPKSEVSFKAMLIGVDYHDLEYLNPIKASNQNTER